MANEVAWTESFSAALAGRYRVERVLGRGGMATVYLAEDVRHHRRVAIKVLRPELISVIPSTRFLAEIRTIATLQHPHILGLIDSGDVDGVVYYVMPFVEGESLRDLLNRETQLPVAVALGLAREVAQALDYAHRHGVVHRDIKPENILLQDGSAVVADFGIALAVSAAGGERLTATGITLGTPQYMAPEQAMGGRAIDARADIYALGAVTYEMLSGEPPFTGPNAQAITARVLTESPRPPSATRASISPEIEAAVLKALEKLPADRYSTASELAGALVEGAATHGPHHQLVRLWPRWQKAFVAALVALALAGGLVGGWAVDRMIERRRAGLPAPTRLALVTPRLAGIGEITLQRQIAISPDGRTVVYDALGDDGYTHLVRQSLADVEPTPIAGTKAGLATPFVSSDGRTILGMVAGERQAYRHPIAGGPGVPLPMPGGYTDFFDWDERGAVWFSPTNGGGLQRVNPGDSTARLVAASAGLRLQQVLPDGRHVLVLREAAALTGPAEIFDAERGTRTPLIQSAVAELRYADGYLIYVLPDGTLEAAPFDAGRLAITGPAVAIGTHVAMTGTGVAQLAVARTGTIAYIVEDPWSLALVDRTGAVRQAVADRRNFHGPRFSPDGRHISVDFASESGRDVWILSLENGSLSRATFAGDGHDATWMPDGRFITYLSARSGSERVYKKRWSGSDAGEPLFASPELGFTGVWLPDASGIVTVVNNLRRGSGADVALITNGGRGPAVPIAATEFTESFPALSPDGRWLAFTSDQSGHLEVYVRSLTAGSADQVQVSLNGGTEAAWAPGGREIFYRTVGDREPKLMAAALRFDPAPTVTSRRELFSVTDYMATQPHAGYDVSPGGKTFVFVRRSPATRIMVLQNLAGLVKR